MRSVIVVALGLCAGCVRQPARDEHAADEVSFVERETGGAQPGDRLPMIVALHGYGGTPESFLGVLEGLHVRARVLAARGIDRVGQGYGWFPLAGDCSQDASAPGMRRAADVLARAIGERSRAQPTCGLPIVVGFSQGGMLSYALAARTPRIVGLALPIGGLLPQSLSPAGKPTGPLPTVLAFHGDADARVPIERDRETWARYATAGYPGGLHEYPGVPHAVSPEMQKDIVDAIERAVHEAGCAK